MLSFLFPGKKTTYIIPERHDEDHGGLVGHVHLREAADLAEAVDVVEGLDGGVAPLLGELVAADVGRVGVLDLLAVLDEELDDLAGGPLGDDTGGGGCLVSSSRGMGNHVGLRWEKKTYVNTWLVSRVMPSP